MFMCCEQIVCGCGGTNLHVCLCAWINACVYACLSNGVSVCVVVVFFNKLCLLSLTVHETNKGRSYIQYTKT